MVRYWNGGLKTGLKKACLWSKCPVFESSAKSCDFTIWILDTHTVQYSDESSIHVFGIQMVTVFCNILLICLPLVLLFCLSWFILVIFYFCVFVYLSTLILVISPPLQLFVFLSHLYRYGRLRLLFSFVCFSLIFTDMVGFGFYSVVWGKFHQHVTDHLVAMHSHQQPW